MVVDGVIRRSQFTNTEGVKIPSQIEQLAEIVDQTIGEKIVEEPALLNDLPEYRYNDNNSQKVTATLRNAVHVLTDVYPEDAERQMKQRAKIELESIKSSISQLHKEGKLDQETSMRLSSITEDLVLITDNTKLAIDITTRINESKRMLGENVNIEDTFSMPALYKAYGIKTAIR